MLAWEKLQEERKAGAPQGLYSRGRGLVRAGAGSQVSREQKSRRVLRLAPRPPHGAGKRGPERVAGGPRPKGGAGEGNKQQGAELLGREFRTFYVGAWSLRNTPGASSQAQKVLERPTLPRVFVMVTDMTPNLGAAIELSVNLPRENYGNLLMVGAVRGAAARGQPGKKVRVGGGDAKAPWRG